MYGLAGTPFEGDGPFIPFASHRWVLEQVVQHLTHRQGILLLLGEPGIGKTTLLHAAAQAAIDAGVPAARIVRLEGNGRVNDDAVPPGTVSEGRWVVLVDNVDPAALDTLQSDLATSGETVAVVAAISMEDPPQSGTAGKPMPWVRLPPLTQPEMQAYVERRLWVAGGATRRLITPDALMLILQEARGLPGVVNRLMEAALTTGFIRGDAMINRKTVIAALGPQQRSRPASPTLPAWVIPSVSLVIFVVGLSAFLYRAFNDPLPPPGPTAKIETSMPANPDAGSSASAGDQSKAGAANSASVGDQSNAGVASAASVGNQSALVSTKLRRGQQALALGDILAARAQFEQAAYTGDAAAALEAGKTYDPDFLPRHPVPSTLPDRARAIAWYQRSAALGNPDAAPLLARMQKQTR
jgi:hypothetical protein